MYLLVCLLGAVPLVFFFKKFGGFTQSLQKQDWENDLVYLFQFYRLKCIPSISPFALKLESWLRLNKIKYESIEGTTFSKGGRQVPFIELNGKEVFDSNIIIPYLQNHFELKEDVIDEVAVGGAHAIMRMLDQHTVFGYFWYRYYEHWVDEFYPLWKFPIKGHIRFILHYMQPHGTKSKGWTVGHGRLRTEQIYDLTNADLKALSLFLGSKTYLTGDIITTADCSAFSHLAQILEIPLNHPFKRYVEEQCPNLVPFYKRIKESLWPDWEQLCQQGY